MTLSLRVMSSKSRLFPKRTMDSSSSPPITEAKT